MESEVMTKEEFLPKAKELVRMHGELYSKMICGVNSGQIHMTDAAFRRIFQLGEGVTVSKFDTIRVRAEITIDEISYFCIF